MPKYKYKAKNLDNLIVKNTIDAKDADDLKKRLRDMNLTLIKYGEVDERHTGYKLKAGEVAEFSRQLASMLSSGITIGRSMEILKDRDFKPKIKVIYAQLYKDVQNGHTLSEAMKLQGGAFPELFVNMMASGEASGQLEKSAEKMAVHYDKENRLNQKIKSAMAYPTILLCTTVIAILLVFTVILPQFFTLFEGIDLPLITQVVMGISTFLTENWFYTIIAVLSFIVLVRFLLTIYAVAHVVDQMKLALPVIGGLLKIIYTARFSRTLSSLYVSGLSMITAINISSTILGNKYIQSQFPEIIKDVRNGEPLSDAVAKIDGFDTKLATSILIGEESGRLDTMLQSVADSFDYEAEMSMERLVRIIEPTVLVVMGVIVCFIMLSVMLPIMTLYNNIGQM